MKIKIKNLFVSGLILGTILSMAVLLPNYALADRTSNFFNKISGIIQPISSNDDFMVGSTGTATSSAIFYIDSSTDTIWMNGTVEIAGLVIGSNLTSPVYIGDATNVATTTLSTNLSGYFSIVAGGGRTGIGTTTPAYLLDLYGGGLRVAPNSTNFGLTINQRNNKGSISIESLSTSDNVFIASAANSTANIFQIINSGNHSLNNLMYLREDHSSSLSSVLFLRQDGSGNLITGANAGNDNNKVFVVESTGRTGIATGTPAYNLDVYGSGRIGTGGMNTFFANGTTGLTTMINASTTLLSNGGQSWFTGQTNISKASTTQLTNSGLSWFDNTLTGSLTTAESFIGQMKATGDTDDVMTLRKWISDTNTQNNVLTIAMTDGGSINMNSGIGAKLVFGVPNADNTDTYIDGAYIEAQKQSAGDSDTSTALAFGTKTNAGSLTQQMIIDQNGNVGIGTTSPATRLDVYTTATTTVSIDSNSKGGCLKIKDYIGGGWTYCRTYAGTMTCNTTSCE